MSQRNNPKYKCAVNQKNWLTVVEKYTLCESKKFVDKMKN